MKQILLSPAMTWQWLVAAVIAAACVYSFKSAITMARRLWLPRPPQLPFVAIAATRMVGLAMAVVLLVMPAVVLFFIGQQTCFRYYAVVHRENTVALRNYFGLTIADVPIAAIRSVYADRDGRKSGCVVIQGADGRQWRSVRVDNFEVVREIRREIGK